MELVVGISGASGVNYGIRLLEVLKPFSVTHLIITKAARKIVEIETDLGEGEVDSLADHVYGPEEFTAPVASGSYPFDAMVVAPCSMRTLAGIASGFSDTLLTRTADVCLKERRKLILVTRETPLSLVQLKNMVHATQAGAVILPACPAFYSKPRNIDDLVDFVVGRVLDLVGVEHELYQRWGTEERKCL